MIAQRRDDTAGRDPDARFDHAAEHDAEAEGPSRMCHADSLADPAGLRELDVDPMGDLRAPSDIGKRVAVLVHVDRNRRAGPELLTPGIVRGQRLLDICDAECRELGDRVERFSERPPFVDVDLERQAGAGADRADALHVEAVAAAELELQALEPACDLLRPSRHVVRVAEPDRPRRRWSDTRKPEELPGRNAEHLALEIVERPVERRLPGVLARDLRKPGADFLQCERVVADEATVFFDESEGRRRRLVVARDRRRLTPSDVAGVTELHLDDFLPVARLTGDHEGLRQLEPDDARADLHPGKRTSSPSSRTARAVSGGIRVPSVPGTSERAARPTRRYEKRGLCRHSTPPLAPPAGFRRTGDRPVSALPATETASRRRIGEILLAHGFVTPEQIADATAEQERTQQPLGQILVGRGAITRLELASALAEQWSDPAASITSSAARPAAPLPAPSAKDEELYAARLQGAVADLARKVQSNKPLEDIDERVEELSLRIEATLARTQHIEAAVATLAESLEGVTTGVEEAFHALQSGTAELAADLVRIDRTIGELAAREQPQADGRALAEIDELRSTIVGLSAGSASVDPELQGRVETLAERLARIESNPAEDRFRADLEDQARTVDDLRAIVDELRERQTGAPDLDERLGSIESRLTATAGGQDELTRQVGALADRVSDRPEADPRIDGVVAQLGALDTRLDTTLTDMVALRAKLDTQDDRAVDGRLDDFAQTLEVLRGELADVVAVPARPDDAVVDRLEELGARIESTSREAAESRDAADRVAALEERLGDGFVTPDALTRSIEWALSEHTAPQTDARVEALMGEIDALRSELASLRVAGERRDAEVDRLAEIEMRVQALDTEQPDGTALAERLDALERARVGDLDTVDVLARAMDRIRHDLTEAPRDEGSSAEALESMAQLTQRIAALEVAREEEPAAQPAYGPDASELASELDGVRLVLERIGLHLGEHDRTLADLSPGRGVHERLEELTSLVQSLAAARHDPAVVMQPPPASSPLPTNQGELLRRVEEAEVASQTDNEKLMSRLERMASSIDWRLQRLETDETDAAEEADDPSE